MEESRYPLGTTDMLISPVGLGCWQFSGGKGLVLTDEQLARIDAASRRVAG